MFDFISNLMKLAGFLLFLEICRCVYTQYYKNKYDEWEKWFEEKWQ